MGIPIPVYRDDDDAGVTLRGQVGQEPCRFGRYTRRLERNPFRHVPAFQPSAPPRWCGFSKHKQAPASGQSKGIPGLTLFCRFGRRIDDLLPDFLGLEHVTPNELGAVDGLYLALRGWPTPGRATEPLNLRRDNVIVTAAAAEAAHADARAARNSGVEARRDGSVASMPELLESSDEDEDEDGGSANAPAAAVAAALEAADAPLLRMPGNARARQRQACAPWRNNWLLFDFKLTSHSRHQVDSFVVVCNNFQAPPADAAGTVWGEGGVCFASDRCSTCVSLLSDTSMMGRRRCGCRRRRSTGRRATG